jgi:hypothetical protein
MRSTRLWFTLPARVVEQAGHHPIPITPVLVGQFDDIVGQTLLIDPALRLLALRRPMLSKRATGATFRHAKFLPHMVNALATTRRA